MNVIDKKYGEGWTFETKVGKTCSVKIPYTADTELALDVLGEEEYHALAMRALRTAFVNYSNRTIQVGNYGKLHNACYQVYKDEMIDLMADEAAMKRFVLSHKDELDV